MPLNVGAIPCRRLGAHRDKLDAEVGAVVPGGHEQ